MIIFIFVLILFYFIGKFDLSTATQNPKLKDENSLPEIMKITTLDVRFVIKILDSFVNFFMLN